MLKVKNLRSPATGNTVANQFVIINGDCVFFQSYDVIVAKKCNGEVVISKWWNYSRTTLKYLYAFLREYCFFYNIHTKKDVEKLIKEGQIKLVEEID